MSAPQLIRALIARDPSIPPARLGAAPSRRARAVDALRMWGWRGALEDFVGLVSIIVIFGGLLLALVAFGGPPS